MPKQVQELLIARGGIQLPQGASLGQRILSDAAGNLSWAPQNLYLQNAAPVATPSTYLWVQTGLGAGTDITIWIEDGT